MSVSLRTNLNTVNTNTAPIVSEENNKENVAPVTPVHTESTGGSFSKQKGGSTAIAMAALLDAMNIQIESSTLRRKRAGSQMSMGLAASLASANNMRQAGKWAMAQSIIAGAGSLAGAAANGVMSYIGGKADATLNTEASGLQTQKATAVAYKDAIDEIDLPQNRLARDTVLGTVDAPTPTAIRKTELLANGDLKATGTNSNPNLSAKLAALDAEDAQTMLHMDSHADKQAFRTRLNKDINVIDDKLNAVEHKRSSGTSSRGQTAQAITHIADGIAKIGEGAFKTLEAEQRAEQTLNDYAATAAAKEADENRQAAATAAGNISDIISKFGQMTQADMRA